MRLALISDIHANLPALEACLADIDKRKIDTVYCLGDLVGYNIWPNEVIQLIRSKNIPTIAGNYDVGIGKSSDDCGCAYKTEEEKAMGKVSIAFTNEIIRQDERDYLRSLPAHIRLEFRTENEKMDLLFVHGSPRRVNEYLFEDREEKSLLRILEQANADVLCFGHTHKPYHRILETIENGASRFRHAINIGSVGKPKDHNQQGGYVVLSINDQSSVKNKESVSVEFIRFDYDVEKAARAIEESILPNAYADMLRKAY